MGDAEFLQLGLEVGGGGVLGLLTGFAAKKLLKLAAALVGAVLALLAVLEVEGLITVRWGALRRMVETTDVGAQLPETVLGMVGMLPVGGGFAVGSLVGFKKG